MFRGKCTCHCQSFYLESAIFGKIRHSLYKKTWLLVKMDLIIGLTFIKLV